MEFASLISTQHQPAPQHRSSSPSTLLSSSTGDDRPDRSAACRSRDLAHRVGYAELNKALHEVKCATECFQLHALLVIAKNQQQMENLMDLAPTLRSIQQKWVQSSFDAQCTMLESVIPPDQFETLKAVRSELFFLQATMTDFFTGCRRRSEEALHAWETQPHPPCLSVQ